MKNLLFVTILWAFSFSLIGEFLAGKIDSYFSVLVRITLALIVFLPFTRFRGVNLRQIFSLVGIGAVQIGFMYMFYYNSFLYLSVAEVALFTIFTPFYVTLIYDAFKLKFRALYLISIAVAVFGAYIIKHSAVNDGFWTGFLLVQMANFCFAFGQSVYKVLMQRSKVCQYEVFGYFYFGAFFVAIVAFLLLGDFKNITPNFTQIIVLLWLGVAASGLGYFLWNKGATEVDSGVLAIMNNALIPAAIIVNMLFWHKDINLIRLIIGAFLLCASLFLHDIIMKFYSKTQEYKS